MCKRITSTLFLMNSVLLAHYFAGAPFRFTHYFLILGLATFCILPEEVEAGPNLAYLALIFQGLGHISLEFVGASASKMSLNHIIAGVLTYQFIVKFDRIIEVICEWFVPVNFTRISLKSPEFLRIFKLFKPIDLKIISHFLLRGPPVLLAI